MEAVSNSLTEAEAPPTSNQQALHQVPVVMLPVDGLVLHAEAHWVPRMQEDQREAFLADVKARGVQDAIIIQKPNVILDGRHRWEGAKARGDAMIPARVVDRGEKEQLDILFGAAMHRRNQTDDQRAIVAAYWYERLVKLSKQERASKGGKARGKAKKLKGSSANNASAKQSDDQAQTEAAKGRAERLDEKLAKQYAVPHRKVKDALELVKHARRYADKVIAGELTLVKAKKEVGSSKEAAATTTKKPKPKPEPKRKEQPNGSTVGKAGTQSNPSSETNEVAEVEDGDFRLTLTRPFDLRKLANALYELLGQEDCEVDPIV